METRAPRYAGHPFSVVNAFSIRGMPFSGNPAGIVFDGDRICDSAKQAAARQLNLVETTFVCASATADIRFRYFTPARELPVTGHPTVAAVGAMLDAGLLSAGATVAIETAGGTIRSWTDGGLVWVGQPPASFRPARCGPARLAAALGLAADDLAADFRPEVSDTGLGHIVAKLKDPDALWRARVDIERLAAACALSGAREAQVFAEAADGTLHTRNFCPRPGEEDPACGNGNAALGAMLARHGLLQAGQTLRIDQGATVNRPSRIHVQRLPGQGPAIAIAVGGEWRRMADGVLHLG